MTNEELFDIGFHLGDLMGMQRILDRQFVQAVGSGERFQLVFGLLVGYALAVLTFRGRGIVFALVLLVQAIPFQLLMIPLYVMIARDYGLSDSYLGMILPFFINSTAVVIFRHEHHGVVPVLLDTAGDPALNRGQALLPIAPCWHADRQARG